MKYCTARGRGVGRAGESFKIGLTYEWAGRLHDGVDCLRHGEVRGLAPRQALGLVRLVREYPYLPQRPLGRQQVGAVEHGALNRREQGRAFHVCLLQVALAVVVVAVLCYYQKLCACILLCLLGAVARCSSVLTYERAAAPCVGEAKTARPERMRRRGSVARQGKKVTLLVPPAKPSGQSSSQ